MENNTITLTEDQFTDLISGQEVKGFEGWSGEVIENEGDYDGEHGAMIDFPMFLYSPDDKTYESCGGYYNEVAGYSFNDDELTFTLMEPKEETITIPLTEYNRLLENQK